MSFHDPKHCCSNQRVVGLESIDSGVRRRLERPFQKAMDGKVHALDSCQVIFCRGHPDHEVVFGVVPDSLVPDAAK